MMRRPKKHKKPRTKDKNQPVTIGRLAVIRCSVRGCAWSRAVRPGQNASEILTTHYREKHS